MQAVVAISATSAITHLTYEATVSLVQTAVRLLSAGKLLGAHPSTARICDVLDETDIVDRVKIIQAYLLEVGDNPVLKSRASVRLATEGVKTVVDTLVDHIDAIHNECEVHATRYFAAWRTPYGLEQHITALTQWTGRLDERMRTLQAIAALASGNQRAWLAVPDKQKTT